LLDLRVVIFCEVEYTALIVNPNRWRGISWWPISTSPGAMRARRRFRYDNSP